MIPISLIKKIARAEKVSVKFLETGIRAGKITVSFNPSSPKPASFRPLAIGEGLRVKVNANIGTSPDSTSLEREMDKLSVAVAAGADAVMDLSTGGNLDKIRRAILAASEVSVGTVPIYQAICETVRRGRAPEKMPAELIFDVIEKQAADGVDFMTIHSGVTMSNTAMALKRRLTGIVSRGGSFLARWMMKNGRENPLYENYDRLLDILKKYNVTISLGDGLRPGSLADANDAAQISELKILGKLVAAARKKGVSVMVEGPGHMPLDQIIPHIKQAKKIILGAPYYVLGPLVTDIAAGYDHITGAIGGALAAWAGADFLCYVTPTEHLGLPDERAVKEGVMASRIAAHAADIARGLKNARRMDDELSRSRKALDWKAQKKLSLDPSKFDDAARLTPRLTSSKKAVCSMCGDYCAMKQV